MDDKVEFNFGNNFIINNDQGLEEEELQDRRRRQEEIHNLLTNALGNCSLTDDSSVNSSSHTAVEAVNDDALASENTEKQYLEANIDDQLKLLYEIRSREVKELNEQLQVVRTELQEHQQISKTKIALLELENERKNISLQEAQNLLVDKTEELNELHKQLENLKYMITCLESNLAEVTDEKEIMRQLNLSLEQQLHLVEKSGFPLMNKSSDRELRESLNNKIKQLEHSLESALKQNEQRVKQHSELVCELKQSIQEKENYLAEKGFLINKLTENFEAAQSQCHELMKTVTVLREEQNLAKEFVIHKNPLETELQKMRENKERAEMCEALRKTVTEEFQVQVNALTTENEMLNGKLQVQQKQLADALHREEIMSIIENEKTALHSKLVDLEEKLQYTVHENKKYQEKLAELAERQFQHVDTSLQTSFSPALCSTLNVSTEFQNLKEENQRILQQFDTAQVYINELETKYVQIQEEHARLKVKVELEEERDAIIKQLQEKAINFEQIIMEKQQSYALKQTEQVSVGINTKQCDDSNDLLLKLKYDALLDQREADLRKALQLEYQSKQDKLVASYKIQFTQTIDCKHCENLKTEINKLIEERKQDRQAVVKLVEMWQDKFDNCITEIDVEYGGRFKILVKILQEQFLKETKEKEVQHIQISKHVNTRLNDRIKTIVAKISQGSIEVDHLKQQLKVEVDRKDKRPK